MVSLLCGDVSGNGVAEIDYLTGFNVPEIYSWKFVSAFSPIYQRRFRNGFLHARESSATLSKLWLHVDRLTGHRLAARR